tara:strand:- start:28922 stop:29662 length:741 start_codon:yes stop_codon:yes gene_type:complete
MDRTIAIVIITILVFIISLIYIIRNRISYRNKNSLFFPKGRNAKERHVIPGNEIYNSTEGFQFSIFTWVYVDNIVYNYGRNRHILTKGIVNINSGIQCPGIWINPRENSLTIKISTKNKTEKFKVEDFPIRKWFSIAVVIKNNTVEIYFNGKLQSTKTLTEDPIINNGDLILTDRGGFSGAMSSLGVYSYALSSKEVLSKHKKGAIPGLLHNILDWFQKLYKNEDNLTKNDQSGVVTKHTLKKLRK